MKTQEEIEQLALNHANEEIEVYNLIGSARETKQAIYTHCLVSYNIAYTQCQEDMVKELKQAIEYGYQLRCNNKPINSGIDWVKEFNSLNKQD